MDSEQLVRGSGFLPVFRIYRDVYLYTVPEVHVYDLKVRALPDEHLPLPNWH